MPVRHIPPLGALRHACAGRMGDDQPQPQLPGVRKARGRILSLKIRRGRMGRGFPPSGSALRLLHDAPPRRLLDVPHGADALQHRRRHAFCPRRGEGAGRRMSPPRTARPLLLLADRLVARRRPARPDGTRHGPPGGKGGRRRLFRLHEGAAHRTADTIRRRGRHLVRRHLGSGRESRFRLAAGRTLRADTRIAARMPDHQQPPSRAVRRRRRAGVRTRPAGREHGRIFGAGDQPKRARR